MSSSRRPGTTTSPSPSTSASSVVRSESSMSVAASSSCPFSTFKPDPAEHQHGRPRRDRAGHQRELLGESLLGDAEFQHVREHYF